MPKDFFKNNGTNDIMWNEIISFWKLYCLIEYRGKKFFYYAWIKKAVIYARYSSTNQREESIEAQVRAYNKYAKDNNYTIVNIYKDSAKSATTANRPAFQQMIADSSKKEFAYVIVHKLDRFSRDRYDSVTQKRKLKQNGVTLLSVTENINDSPESIMMESVLEVMAEYYSKNLAREIMKGQNGTFQRIYHDKKFTYLQEYFKRIYQ